MEVEIVDFEPQYSQAFCDVNLWWVKEYFSVEPMDLEKLKHPQENIIDKGGYILIALLNDKPVGACALVKRDEYEEELVFELSKMGVLPEAQGKKVGFKLAKACIDLARAKKATKVYLESSTTLKPAINLYKKLGFVVLENFTSPYKRANIAMELVL